MEASFPIVVTSLFLQMPTKDFAIRDIAFTLFEVLDASGSTWLRRRPMLWACCRMAQAAVSILSSRRLSERPPLAQLGSCEGTFVSRLHRHTHKTKGTGLTVCWQLLAQLKTVGVDGEIRLVNVSVRAPPGHSARPKTTKHRNRPKPRNSRPAQFGILIEMLRWIPGRSRHPCTPLSGLWLKKRPDCPIRLLVLR